MLHALLISAQQRNNLDAEDEKTFMILLKQRRKKNLYSTQFAHISELTKLIKMTANDPNVLFLDEPTNHLDLPSIEELEDFIQKYSGAIIFVSHDNYFEKRVGGKIVEVGTK